MALSNPLTQKLAQLPLFHGLTSAQIRTIAGITEEVSFAKQTKVFAEGQPGDALYAVLEGEVDVIKRDAGGEEQVLARITEDGVLGEMSLLNGTGSRSATAVAATDVRALRLSSAKFSELLGDEDLGALKIIHNIARTMAGRLHLMNQKLLSGPSRPEKKEEFLEFQKLLCNWSF